MSKSGSSKKSQSKDSEMQGHADGKTNGESPRIASTEDLKTFLIALLERMNVTGDSAAPIYVLSAMNHVLSLSDIYNYLDEENKEIARAIWLKMKQAGVQLRNPPLLFPEAEAAAK